MATMVTTHRSDDGRNPVRVSSISDLYSAVADRAVTRVELDLVGLDHAQRNRWEQLLNDELGRCGCSEGRAGLAIGLLGSLASMLVHRGTWRAPNTGVAVISAAIGGAAVGRGVGTERGRRRARRRVVALDAALGRADIGGAPRAEREAASERSTEIEEQLS